MNFKLITVIAINLLCGVNSLTSMYMDQHKRESAPLRCRAIEAGVQIYECLVPGTFALTFDDGPYIYTKQLLSILKRMKAKATFFVIGEMVDNPDYGKVLKQIEREGHQIASHSYTHPHLNELTDEQIETEISKTSDAIEKRLGRKVNYFRCPYGECDERVLNILNEKGYKVINWSLDTLDWTGKSPSEIIAVYETGLKPIDPNTSATISLQHDIHPNTIASVSRMIKIIRDKGFTLTTVAECMGETF